MYLYVKYQPAPVTALGVFVIYATVSHFSSKGERQHTCLLFENNNHGDDHDHDHGNLGQNYSDDDDGDGDLVGSRPANSGAGLAKGHKGEEDEQGEGKAHHGDAEEEGGELGKTQEVQ